MPLKNGISWNGLLAAYVQNGRIEDAKSLFESKMDWMLVSWNCLMGGFVRKRSVGIGEAVALSAGQGWVPDRVAKATKYSASILVPVVNELFL
ncbi:hypothetical protein OIU78_017098 [Salix suchowensis]|nr:hypothetical protein OIU78_017098 [Salix suchowensis]